MARSTRSINAQRLKDRYLQATKNDILCGISVLNDLAKIASGSVQQTTGPQKVVAYILCSFFEAVAYDFHERPVSVTEATSFQAQFHQPVLKAIEYLLENDPEASEAVSRCEDIIVTQSSKFPMR